MRSVVVVLPASMWAMIPIFRVFSSVNLRGMQISSLSTVFLRRVALSAGKETGPFGPVSFTCCEVGPVRSGLCLARLHVKDQRLLFHGGAPWQRQSNIAGA